MGARKPPQRLDPSLIGTAPPPTITALRPLASRPGVISVFVDGRRAEHVGERALIDLGLHVGMGWTPSISEAVRRAASLERAERDGARFLSRRARSESAARAHLIARGHDAGTVEEIIRRLRSAGAIDDRAMAQAEARSAQRRLPESRHALVARGERAGIDPATMHEAIEREGTPPDAQLAVQIVRERMPGWLASEQPASAARRAMSLLERRGFSEEVAEHAVRSALRESGASLPESSV